MKKIACITSLSQSYYDHCGKACLDSFVEFWPKDVHLYVYNEDMKSPYKKKNVFNVWWKELHRRTSFLEFERRTENTHVIKFAKKAYSIIHALENLNYDRIIWLDADSYSTRPMTHQFLNLISPDDVLSSHFGVQHHWPSETDPNRVSFSCETGFFIVNKTHPMFNIMVNRYKQYYEEDLGYNLRRFYDGEVYGAVVAEMQAKGAKLMELSPDITHKTPVPISILSPYINHMKAGRKDNVTNTQILEKLSINDSQ